MRTVVAVRAAVVLALAVVIACITGAPSAGAATTCSFTTTGITMALNGNCQTDQTISVPNGYTLDGAGHTITAVDPSVDHFLGAVVTNAGTSANVMNLTVKTSGLTDTCDAGVDRLRGIMLDTASGTLTNNTVLHGNHGA